MSEPHAQEEQSSVDALGLLMKSIPLLAFSGLVGYVANYKLQIGSVASVILGACIFGVGLFSLLQLKGSPKEMGFTLVLKFCSVTAYKILNFTLVMWLVKDLGYVDANALGLIVVWGMFMTVATIVSGSLTDALGLRRTLFVGVTLCVLTRLVMVFATSKWLALACGLMPLAVGEALCTPVLVAAMRRYSKPSQRTVAFSLFYALMNFGFMFGYFISDSVRSAMKDAAMFEVPGMGVELSPYGTLLLVSLAFDLLMFPFVWFLKPGVQMTNEGFVSIPEGHEHKTGGLLDRVWLTIRDAAVDTVHTLSKLLHSEGFWKLVVFLVMIGLLKLVFNIMDYVLTPFTEREIGPDAADKVGRLNATNSIMILVLAPVVGMLTRKYASYSMVILGGFITAASFVFMAAPSSAFVGLSEGWLGKAVGNEYLGIVGAVHPYYVMIFLWQVVFSVGEAFYSPRVYEYAASIAPPGQEASYSSLSYIPLLIGKFSTGALFAGLLAHYCPAEGPRNSPMMWLIVGLLVLVAPVGLFALKSFIRVEEER